MATSTAKIIQNNLILENSLPKTGKAEKTIAACQLGKEEFQNANSFPIGTFRISKGLSLNTVIFNNNTNKVETKNPSHKGGIHFLFLSSYKNKAVTIKKTTIPEPILVIHSMKKSNESDLKELIKSVSFKSSKGNTIRIININRNTKLQIKTFLFKLFILKIKEVKIKTF